MRSNVKIKSKAHVNVLHTFLSDTLFECVIIRRNDKRNSKAVILDQLYLQFAVAVLQIAL